MTGSETGYTPRLLRPTWAQLVAATVLGVAAALLAGIWLDGYVAALLGIGVGELVFVTLSMLTLWPMDAAATERNVGREDLSPIFDEVLVAIVAALAVVSVLIVQQSGNTALGAVLTLVGVFGAWACIHQTYAVHYAYEYYLDDNGGIDFHSKSPPCFADFLYLSYAVGMTYGSTDPELNDTRIRKILLRHAAVSFLFGMVILAVAINLVAGVLGIGG
ncbi:DUF1345 domain-containing protein [Gulosibacter sediminis]|uniref:DUF1345 domain-containing protein n=1 Tax=Gulosibacter sediminis TaxID=1729695 RepID=UPI0024A94B56|nr:DUF1345 domain-containing protein [Gulosibacter sediminis]